MDSTVLFGQSRPQLLSSCAPCNDRTAIHVSDDDGAAIGALASAHARVQQHPATARQKTVCGNLEESGSAF